MIKYRISKFDHDKWLLLKVWLFNNKYDIKCEEVFKTQHEANKAMTLRKFILSCTKTQLDKIRKEIDND